MVLGKPGQTALKRHRDVGTSKIENDQTKATRAQKLLSRGRDDSSMKHADDDQCGKINSAVSRVGRIKKASRRLSHPAHGLALFLRFPDKTKSESQSGRAGRSRNLDEPPAIAARLHGDG